MRILIAVQVDATAAEQIYDLNEALPELINTGGRGKAAFVFRNTGTASAWLRHPDDAEHGALEIPAGQSRESPELDWPGGIPELLAELGADVWVTPAVSGTP